MNSQSNVPYDVFISYRWVDPDQIWVREQLVPALKSAGLKVLLDIEDFVPGRDLILEMSRAGSQCHHAICVISPDYFDGDRMVGFESLMARRLDPSGKESRLIPLILRKTDLPEHLRGLIPVDWTNPKHYQREWNKLLKVVGAKRIDANTPGSLDVVSSESFEDSKSFNDFVQKLFPSKPPLEVYIHISDNKYGHMPIFRMKVTNNTDREIPLKKIEFVTEDQWDLSNPGVHSTMVPAASLLNPEAPVIKIEAKRGSIAQRYLRRDIKANTAEVFTFVLLTDHSPGYAIGLFLFLLQPKLIYGEDGNILHTPQLLVSIHGQAALGSTHYSISKEEFIPIEQTANEVLCKIPDDVISALGTIASLEKVASGLSKSDS